MISIKNQTTEFFQRKEFSLPENQNLSVNTQHKKCADNSSGTETALSPNPAEPEAGTAGSTSVMTAEKIKIEKERTLLRKHYLTLLHQETGNNRIDSAVIKTGIEKLAVLLRSSSFKNNECLNQAKELAAKNANARQINQIMDTFYDMRIHQQDEQQIQETFDILRFETDLLSLNTTDNAWGRDLAEKHWEAIGATRDNYLEVFLKAFEKMNSFYADFVALKSSLAQFIHGANDKGEVYFQGEEFGKEIDKLIAKYALPSGVGQLFPETGKTASQEECEQWIKQMGLPAGSLVRTNGGYTVRIDLSAIEKMKEGLYNGNWSANKLSAWETGFNSQGDILQNTLQMFTQKMTNANSLYDNLVKIFNSFIEQDFSAAKGYFNF
ncbi:IpaD/SipD/SspD family type III secretion system needle tip protein [Pantoea sp. Bo_7]|uniref:IpaD/SipD/SspD family type III secretion system needle tip protein n=1 Tax=unclassified Pantoea TaxID=2630326 RepID=UPI001232EB92|nr:MULTISPECIES: IpaD/SipD/SspD family type III secretion system needle tip protein [unclassified Pantoea]KAA6043268.1 IpaD/SipD/SspD family type III secretion system needle tip protein [Pantoea sp. Bo_7]KAA6088252.1 IpaD/SipD/SspD family type III secretion system needle tip protein [Pantoea sp. Bo_10]